MFPNLIATIFFLLNLQAGEFQPHVMKDNLIKHINYLGSDLLMGRGTGTKGSERAAEYIARTLEACQLIPLAENNSYFQYVPMHGSTSLDTSKLNLVLPDTQISLVLNDDYLLYQSGAQTFIPNPLPLVFVGYGIIAPEYDYNDYQSVDVTGKIVVFIDGEPESDDESFFLGKQQTLYSSPDTKQRLALARGARGSIFIPSVGKKWREWQRAFAFENITLAYTVSGHLSMMINPEIAPLLFYGADFSLSDVDTNAAKGVLTSFALKTKLSFQGSFTERDFRERNVAAMLEGENPALKNTYLLLSAHYDHLGIGPAVDGDSIYNGVFDNASGVAGLLEIARLFSEMPRHPQRSVVFLFLTGEEMGLLGSTYYTDHPLVPLYKTIANINIDGLALFEEFEDVIAVGAEYSSLKTDVEYVLEQMHLKLMQGSSRVMAQPEIINSSDHFAFAKAGIPFLCIVEGLKYKKSTVPEGLERIRKWNKSRYHTPFDDLSQSMDFNAAVEHCELIFRIALHLANQEKEPEWNTGSPFVNRRLQTIAEKR